jgi:GMP synthase-like glutamine amidotransferase
MLAPLRLCIVDMNAGVKNEAMRCFRDIVDHFLKHARTYNPTLDATTTIVQPRNLGELPPERCDFYLSTGGPGSPHDGYDDPWCTGYRGFLDGLVSETLRGKEDARAALLVCHSFEIAIQHFAFATMERRTERKFGVMPVYMTEDGLRSPLLGPFGERLFVWEHRDWEAVGLDKKKLAQIGGELWARESRDGYSKGRGLAAFRFAPAIEGTQFHPEADKAGALAWMDRPEQKDAAIAAYGEVTYERMRRTLNDPMRIDRTFHTLIPGWLVRQFNRLAPKKGWVELGGLV